MEKNTLKMGPIPALLLALFAGVVSTASQASTLDRDRDPVILVGAQLPLLRDELPPLGQAHIFRV